MKNNLRVAIFIDAANLEHSVKDLGWKVNYRKLRSYLQSLGEITSLGYYCPHFGSKEHKIFLDSLRARKFKICSKPLKIIRSRNKLVGDLRKANFDVEIAVDAILKKEDFDILILFSGDSDFHYLIKVLQKDEKKIIVISTRFHIARELAESADKYIDLRDLKKAVSRVKRA